MAKQFSSIDDRLRDFIARQHIFFTASATSDSRVNVSPREILCLRIISPNTAIYLDRTGSGNETAAHMKADGRLTIMFCAVEGPPMILRLYGHGRIIHRSSTEYRELLHDHYADQEPLGARQIVRLDFDLVKRPAVSACRFSPMKARGRASTNGRKLRVPTASRNTGARRTASAWMVCRPACLTAKLKGKLSAG